MDLLKDKMDRVIKGLFHFILCVIGFCLAVWLLNWFIVFISDTISLFGILIASFWET